MNLKTLILKSLDYYQTDPPMDVKLDVDDVDGLMPLGGSVIEKSVRLLEEIR